MLAGLANVAPFERIDGQPVMRFDALTVSVDGSAVRVGFRWGGDETAWHQASLGPGETFTLSGLDGRIGVSFECP